MLLTRREAVAVGRAQNLNRGRRAAADQAVRHPARRVPLGRLPQLDALPADGLPRGLVGRLRRAARQADRRAVLLVALQGVRVDGRGRRPHVDGRHDELLRHERVVHGRARLDTRLALHRHGTLRDPHLEHLLDRAHDGHRPAAAPGEDQGGQRLHALEAAAGRAARSGARLLQRAVRRGGALQRERDPQGDLADAAPGDHARELEGEE